MRNFFRNWLPPICWAVGIFYLSSIPNLRSSLPSAWDFIFRKAAHVAEYAVLAFLAARSLKMTSVKTGALFYPVVFSLCLAYAMADECHQTFVVGRHGSFFDAGIDGMGILSGMAMHKAIFRSRQK